MSKEDNGSANNSKFAQSIIKAIVETKKEVGKLAKSEKNPFHKYNYTPIDAYYEHVASVASSNGLTWRNSLDSVTVFSEGTDDKGRDTQILKFTFKFDLLHENGEVWPDWQFITILHPVQGAQTTGSAMSYAEKLHLRTTYSVVTGEDDVDSGDSSFKIASQRRRSANQPPAKVEAKNNTPRAAVPITPIPTEWSVLNPENLDVVSSIDATTTIPTPILNVESDVVVDGAQKIFYILDAFLDMCPDIPTLQRYYSNNKAVIAQLKDIDTKRHDALLDKFRQRKEVISNTGSNNNG